jgi:alkylation response protein AidB-like acyl-CoA dehydrogenase
LMSLESLVVKAKNIAVEYLREGAAAVDAEGKWVAENMKALLDAGLGGLVIPTESGGHGFGLLALVKICEELGKECASTGLCYGMHCVGSAVISAKATPFQKKHFLESISKGEHITTIALSEPGTGAHFYFPQTELKIVSESEYLLNGIKSFITNGGQADSYVVSTVAAESDAAPDQFSCVIVPAGSEGLNWGPEWSGMGMRGNSSKSAELRNIKLNEKYIIGAKGDQLWYVFNVITPYFIMAMSGTYLGIAQAAIEEGIQHLKNRQYNHSGSKLSEIQLLQYKIGQLWSKLESTRSLIYHAASEGDKRNENTLPFILAAKAEVATTCISLVNDIMTLMGGIGYQRNTKLERMLRDARASHVMSPTTDLLYTWIGRDLLEQPILSE